MFCKRNKLMKCVKYIYINRNILSIKYIYRYYLFYNYNMQIENHFANGKKEITFPDSTRKIIHPDGVQDCYFADGTSTREFSTTSNTTHRSF